MMSVLLLIALALPPGRETVDAAVKHVLGEEQFRFCHRGDYPIAVDEAGWCPLIGGDSARCPALPAACKAGPAPGLASGKGTRARRATPGTGKAPEEEPERSVLVLPALGGIAQLVFWVVVLGGIAAILVVIVQNLVRGGGRPEKEAEAAARTEVAAAAAGGGDAVETDVERLLARARAAAGRGDYGRAVDDAYAALLRRLDGDGLIRIHISRTNGDYVRDLRPKPELSGPVRGIVRDVERLQFGKAEASADLFHSVMDRVVPIAQRSLGALLFALALGASLSCGGMRWVGRGPSDNSPSGRAGVLAVLQQLGIKARHRVEPLQNVSDKTGAIVLLPGVRIDERSWTALLNWVDGSGFLVIATGDDRWSKRLGVKLDPAAAANDLAHIVLKSDEEHPIAVAMPDRHGLKLENVDSAAPLVKRGQSPYGAWIERGKGAVMVLADDHLFENVSLAVADDAHYLVSFLGQIDQTVELCDELTGMASPSPMASVARGRLAPLAGQLFLLLLVFFLYKGVAFGAARDPSTSSRRAFVEHVRAVGTQYAKARARRHALTLYSVYALDRLRERIQLGGRRGLSGLAEAVAQKTGRPETEVLRLLVEAQSARDASASAGALSQEDLSIVRELGRLLQQTGGSR